MEHKIITIFYIIDEYLKIIGKKDDVRAKISNSEIMLIGYLAVSSFNGNYYRAYEFSQMMKLVKKIDYSRFIRRIRDLEKAMENIFLVIGEIFKKAENLKIYLIDSFPVQLCDITREKRCRLWNDEKFKGYNASKKRFIYGLKVHMIVNTNKEPIFFYISNASTHDITASYNFAFNLPENSILIGDKGYVSSNLANFLGEFNINLSPIFRKNMKKDNEYFIKRKIRKSIETVFSVITSKFGKYIRATSFSGFLTKLKLFLLSYSLDCFYKANYATI